MDMTPRLAVTQEQAADLIDGFHVLGKEGGTLRLPERPTMRRRKPWAHHWETVPIPEGTEVEVGWWECGCIVDAPPPENHAPEAWRPVATATLAEIDLVSAIVGPLAGYHVTLTNLRPIGADQ